MKLTKEQNVELIGAYAKAMMTPKQVEIVHNRLVKILE